jgi:hypothetical protein
MVERAPLVLIQRCSPTNSHRATANVRRARTTLGMASLRATIVSYRDTMATLLFTLLQTTQAFVCLVLRFNVFRARVLVAMHWFNLATR